MMRWNRAVRVTRRVLPHEPEPCGADAAEEAGSGKRDRPPSGGGGTGRFWYGGASRGAGNAQAVGRVRVFGCS